MNILHMKYAVEVARLGSLNRAAESLLIAQPNISRSIKELEADIGITIFHRSSRGMSLTPEGEEFIGYARSILRQIDSVESYYRAGVVKRQKFSVAVPSAAYISDAFSAFLRELDPTAVEIGYHETGAQQALELVQNGECKLGIIRYPAAQDKAIKALLEEKGMVYEMAAEFSMLLIMAANALPAQIERITADMLAEQFELFSAEDSALTPAAARAARVERGEGNRILVDGEIDRFALLAAMPRTYMWSSPVAHAMLAKYGLVRRECADLARPYRDMLFYRADHKLTAADQAFITALCVARRTHFAD